MTQFLPPNLLALFNPRDPIPYLPPVDQLPYEKQTAGYTGLAAFVKHFEDPAKTPAPFKIATREEKRESNRKWKAETIAYKLEQDIALWQPNANPNATSDPYRTLFVARINYDTSESKILREFQVYGPIRKVVKVHNSVTMAPRGYAFIEYEHARDMHTAYKHADGKKLSGRRVLVDVERGRIVKGWLPRRLGGGLGGTRKGGPDVNIKHSGREEAPTDHRNIGGGMRKDRNMDRDRERPERPERRRSRSRERRRRSRSRSRDRDRSRREERRKRDRSRDPLDRGRHDDGNSITVKTEAGADGTGEGGLEAEAPPRKERRRSRSRDRERKHRRSRSRDRKRRDHDRDRDRDRESRRERAAAEREERNERPEEEVSRPPEPNPEGFNASGYEGGEYNNFINNGEANTYDGY